MAEARGVKGYMTVVEGGAAILTAFEVNEPEGRYLLMKTTTPGCDYRDRSGHLRHPAIDLGGYPYGLPALGIGLRFADERPRARWFPTRGVDAAPGWLQFVRRGKPRVNRRATR